MILFALVGGHLRGPIASTANIPRELTCSARRRDGAGFPQFGEPLSAEYAQQFERHRV